MKHKIKIAITLFSMALLLSYAGGAAAQPSGPIAWWPGDGNAVYSSLPHAHALDFVGLTP